MKRIVYIATMVALLATACQKTDVINVVEDTIDFGTQVGKLTKADDASYAGDKFTTLIQQGFRVWAVADFTLGIDTDGQIYRGLSNLPVVCNNNRTSWDFDQTVTKKYFWPAGGKNLFFYTISADDDTWLKSIDYDTNFLPASTESNGLKVKASEVTGLSLPPFEVKPDANDDIMVADQIRQDKDVSKKVSPTFRHTMTKVEFNFKQGVAGTTETSSNEASVVILKGITTDELINEGTLAVNYNFQSATAEKPAFKWTPSSDASKVLAFVGAPATELTIVKKGGQVIPTVAPENPENGNIYVKYTAATEAAEGVAAVPAKYEVVKYVVSEGTTEGAWVTEETHTYDATAKKWASDAEKPLYETFKGVVLTTTQTNFVTWYMIPQPIDTKNVTIEYVADGKHLHQKFALKGTSAATATTPITWGEEVCVKYNVTIAPHKIEFSPSVGNWDQYDSNADDKDGNQDVEMEN